ncbi:uncharacterized protein LOC121645151 isoform X2 [Melanotaenia boesemani]|uniref:uncharacterized protein LOC121645151 isoform X2 n=1 Tax=Melanotaenia boesemani TaxID=1250792 RepID=UPI001C057573|nr:uncharacterized protein LOC121645151 isoform X2 [Melanotaenia boesemani]
MSFVQHVLGLPRGLLQMGHARTPHQGGVLERFHINMSTRWMKLFKKTSSCATRTQTWTRSNQSLLVLKRKRRNSSAVRRKSSFG